MPAPLRLSQIERVCYDIVVNWKAVKMELDAKLMAAIIGALNAYLDEENRPDSSPADPPPGERHA